MPLSEGYRNIPLRRNLVVYFMDRWTDEATKHPDSTHKEFGGFVNDILEKLAYKEIYVKEEYPNMSTFGVQDDVLYIQDAKIPGRFVDIRIKEGKLCCDYDNTDCCDHIHFANTQNEVSNLRNHKKKKLVPSIIP